MKRARTTEWSTPEDVDRIVLEATIMRNAYFAELIRSGARRILASFKRMTRATKPHFDGQSDTASARS